MPLEISQIKALCFDVDGTLRDTDDQYVQRLTRLLGPFRPVFPDHDPHKAARRLVMTFDTPINAVYTALDWLSLDHHAVRLIERLQRRDLRSDRSSLPLVPGVLECLERLSPAYPMAVVSARGKTGTDRFLREHGLERFFGCVAHGQTTPHTKPWPDPVLWAAARLGVAPEECLMIGDTTVDMRAGCSAGAQTLGVLSGFGSQKELARAGADHILPSAADLPDLLGL